MALWQDLREFQQRQARFEEAMAAAEALLEIEKIRDEMRDVGAWTEDLEADSAECRRLLREVICR